MARFQLSQEKEDLDRSILHYTQVIFLPPLPRDGSDCSIVELMFLLASAILHRCRKVEQPEGIKYSIQYLWYLRGLPWIPSKSPETSSTSLIEALAAQITSEAGEVAKNIEMTLLCRELLTSDLSAGFPDTAFTSLSKAINTDFMRGWSESLAEATECLRVAVKICPPRSPFVLLALANTRCIRCIETDSNEDSGKATALLETILDLNQPVECPDSFRSVASELATAFAFIRSGIIQNQNIPKWQYFVRSELRLTSEEFRLLFTESLAVKTRERFTQYSLAESLEDANSYNHRLSSRPFILPKPGCI
ncbi:hypothetical protein EI94DRAFT_1802251 [Lactarius quietus]|nr:hypothetical protein EI94DRAFT_1802251 [Lactarius quietus]